MHSRKCSVLHEEQNVFKANQLLKEPHGASYAVVPSGIQHVVLIGRMPPSHSL